MRRPKQRNAVELASIADYIAKYSLVFGVIFIVLALASLLLTSPDALTKGLYAFVLGLNAVIVLGSLAVRRLLRRSEEKLNSKKKAAGEQRAGIDMWLDKQEGKDS